MPFFSVIIPLYNKAAYIEKAVESVLGQTYVDFELIVVDDGSADDGAQRAERLNDSRMRVVGQANAGVSTARNNGVRMSKGKYICFLDADDWWDEHFLEEMAALTQRHPDAGIYGCSYYLVKLGKNRRAPIGIDNDFAEGEINYCQVYAKTLCMPLCTDTVCIPREVFDMQGGFKSALKLGEDFDLWIRIALQHKVVLLNKPLAYYNQDADISNRAIAKLHPPHAHMLWNLDYLAAHEKTNADYKTLIDRLRVSTLLRYYVTKQYCPDAQKELQKVDWSKQPRNVIQTYRMPLPLLRWRYHIRAHAAHIKKSLLKLVSR